MGDNILYYVILLVILIIGLTVLKKVASCMIKTVVGIVLLAAAVAVYWLYLK
jgi:hypothetical protein